MKVVHITALLAFSVVTAACGDGAPAAPRAPAEALTPTPAQASAPPAESGQASPSASSSSAAPPPSSSTPAPPAPPPATFAAQASAGEPLFDGDCARCHGADGGGGAGPRLVGDGALASFASAESLAEFIRSNMPEGAAGTLDAGDAYALTAFLLSRNGVTTDAPLDATTAPAVAP